MLDGTRKVWGWVGVEGSGKQRDFLESNLAREHSLSGFLSVEKFPFNLPGISNVKKIASAEKAPCSGKSQKGYHHDAPSYHKSDESPP